MQTEQAYVTVETLISIAINVALSIGFVFLVFHGQSRVSTTGRHGLILDMAPQTFMVVLMSFLVPALLTRRRLIAGALPWRNGRSAAAGVNLPLRAFMVALLSTCLVLALSWLALPKLLPAPVAFHSLIFPKAAFGGALAALVTPFAVRTALR